MNLIKKIEIKHFRSINELVIEDVSDINVFSGLNDVGKSNVLKALNLFFKNQVDWQSNLNFERDINSWHAHMAPHGHNKKFISVRLEFNRPNGRYKSLRTQSFWIRREWDKDIPLQPLPPTWGKDWQSTPELTWNRGLTWFLKQCKFYYVPAVRDRNYLRHLLAEFSKSITEAPDPELKTESKRLSNMIASRSSNLRSRLKEVTGKDVSFELPQTMLALLEASGLNTEGDIPLQLRGDGIQSLAVVGILADLTSKLSKNFYFWGFEEPENSLEYIKAAQLADEIRDRYSANVQVFLTTHSPAFVAMKDKASIYRIDPENMVCTKDHEEEFRSVTSSIQQVSGNTLFDDVSQLSEDLGFLEVMRCIDDEFREHESMRKEFEELKRKRDSENNPILVVEGPNDCSTLCHAWGRLYAKDMPFDILDAGGTQKMTSLLCNSRTINRHIFALYDHDEGGATSIQKLNECGFIQSNHHEFFDFSYKHWIVARTLPAPPGRECNAKNLNLPLEFYFSNSVLLDVHEKSGKKLFSRTNYVKDCKPYHVDEDTLNDLILQGKVTRVHRKLDTSKGVKRSGKSYLVANLPCLPDEEFETFHSLFETIIDHLGHPEFTLTRKSKPMD